MNLYYVKFNITTMKAGIIGSGKVAQELGLGLLKLNYEVMLGTRNVEKLESWQNSAGQGAKAGSFADAAEFGDFIILATKWEDEAAFKAIEMAGKNHFAGKIVIDVTNPIHIRPDGGTPEPALGFPESAGKKVQEFLLRSKVVKAFNIVTAKYMCQPELEDGIPEMFIAGNDPTAKAFVQKIAADWGWPVSDMGDISQSYLLEALALLWVRYGFLNNHWTHAFSLLKK